MQSEGNNRQMSSPIRANPNYSSAPALEEEALKQEKTSYHGDEITMEEFLHSIGLDSPKYADIFKGISCDQLLEMTDARLYERILRWIVEPDKRTELKTAIGELRKCVVPNHEVCSNDLPELGLYLKSNGIYDWIIKVLKDRNMDTRKFLDSTRYDLSKLVLTQAYLDELMKCHAKLRKEVYEQSSEKFDKIDEVLREQTRNELQRYLDSLNMRKYLSICLDRNVPPESLQSMSEEELVGLGISTFDAKLFMFSRNTSSTFNAGNRTSTSETRISTSSNPSHAEVTKDSSCGTTACGVAQDSEKPKENDSNAGKCIQIKTTSAPPVPSKFTRSSGTLSSEEVGDHGGHREIKTVRKSAEGFLRRLDLSIPADDNDSLYSAHLAQMNDKEIKRLVTITLNFCRQLQLENDDLKRQILALSGAGSSRSASNEVEQMDVDENTDFRFNGHQTPNDTGTTKEFVSTTFAQEELQPVPVFQPHEALNILLLGETGVGKSTFINSFANYVNYETLEEAKSKKMLALIPASFSVSDDNYVDHKVSIGSNLEVSIENECLSGAGQSSTQSCKSYVFPSKQGAIRIIDTPGVGDTRGIDQDALNFANILAYISQYPELHAICILLKPNNAKLTAGFRLCINQLLNNLEKSASRNIIFIFTNARSTFYQPGDTKPVLENVLLEVENHPPYIRIKFDQSTSYCVDNEAFRFLAAISNGLNFLEADSDTFAESWTKSVEECRRLMEHILTLEPHKVRDTVSISEARRLIDELSNPVADIIAEMSMNMTRVKEQMDFLERNRGTKEGLDSLKKKLFTNRWEIVYKPLQNARTVCSSEKCLKFDPAGQPVITQVCHEVCFLTNNAWSTGNMGDPSLKQCGVMRSNGNCGVCGCNWKDHMRVDHIKMWKEVVAEDMEVKKLLRSASSVDEAICVLQNELASFVKERKMLLDVMAFFNVFQSINSITGRGDPFQDCLNDHIKISEFKKKVGLKNEGIIQKLKRALSDYEDTKTKLSSQRDAKDCMKLTAENVVKYERVIYDLPLHGSRLRQLRETVQRGRVKDVLGSAETVVELTSVSGGGAATSILQPVDSYFAKK